MEYYLLLPVGILLSHQERSKEEVKEILTATIQSPSESIGSYLAKQRIEKVVTFMKKVDNTREFIREINQHKKSVKNY